jgi:hypothetical protein
MSTKPVKSAPSMLPSVDTPYILPTPRPSSVKFPVTRRIASGPVMASRTSAGAKRTAALTSEPAFTPSGVVATSTAFRIQTASTNAAAPPIVSSANARSSGQRSAAHPPAKYPAVSAASVTPISDDHT